jgi:Domain of unknown function (DUF4034)
MERNPLVLWFACAVALAGCAPARSTDAVRAEAEAREELEQHFVVTNARHVACEFGLETRRMLLDRRYTELETLVDSLRTHDVCFPSGRPKLSSFYRWTFENDDRSPIDADTWSKLLYALRDWRSSRPDAPTPAIALAHALVARAWAARGGGYAHTVKARNWPRFEEDIDAARTVLRHASRAGKSCPGWYSAMLEVALCSSASTADYDLVFEEGVAAFPTYEDLYTHKARRLQPRWFGEPGDWERFANEIYLRDPAGRGPELYARIVRAQAFYADNVFEESPQISWERTREGLRAWQARCPESDLPLCLTARLAVQAGRADEARAAFRDLGNRVDLDAWNGHASFWRRSRSWALSNAGRRG